MGHGRFRMWRSRLRAAAAAAGVASAFLVALATAAPLFGGGTQGISIALLIIVFVFIVALLVPTGTKTPPSPPPPAQGLAPPVSTRPSRLGLLLDWFERRRREEGRRQIAFMELEGETNRRAVALLKVEAVRGDSWALGQLLPDKKRALTESGSLDRLFKRAAAISAIENAYGLPDPLDTHAFILERLGHDESAAAGPPILLYFIYFIVGIVIGIIAFLVSFLLPGTR